MIKHLSILQRSSHRRTLFVGLLSFTSIVMVGQAAPAAELGDHAHSLRSVPADVAFYSASLRLKEQFDTFLQSKAYARLMEIPVLQLAKMQVSFQWQQSTQPTIAQAREYLQSSEGKDALAVLKEMFSEEVFLVGGADIADTLKLFMELNTIQRTARLEAAAKGEKSEEVMVDRVLKLLDERSDEFKVPTLVFGFRIQDADRAKRQLDEVHSLVRNLLDEHQPEMSAHLQRDQIAEHEFLTLRLDSSMIPWDKIREEAEDIDEEQLEKWKDALSDKTVAVALGVVDEFVLLSIGASTEHLETMGQGPFLAEQPAIKLLNKHADQRVASITYVSEALAQSLNSPEKTIEDLAGTADEVLQQADIPEEQRDALVEDVRSLDISRYMPKPGYAAGVTFLTPRGYEGFQYFSGTKPMMDSSKPLTILEHVGGSPAMCLATRSNDTVEDYDQAVTWISQTAGHVEKVLELKADAEDWAKYMEYRDRIIALLQRVDKANREFMYPAFEDNQAAIVLDVSAEGTQWIKHMPESPKPLPMLELGIVASVSDAEKLRQGVREYAAVVKDGVALAREAYPDKIPEFECPKSEKRELSGGGALRVVVLPEDWGLDPQVAPNAGLTDTAAVLSTMPSTSERLLQSTPLAIDTPLDLKRPAASVSHIEFHKMVGALRPWIDYGLDVAMGKLKVEDEDNDAGNEENEEDTGAPQEQNPIMLQMGFIVPQVQQFLDVASTLRSASSVSYQEEGVWVTHSETHFQDLK